MASLSVVLPTLNSMPLMQRHLESMRPWIDLATEIIVVDSFSNDGTLEYLQRELAGLPAQFHSQPRGLYQCWNFGIQQASKNWLYISTVGDSITADLLSHLIDLGQTGNADIVISRPHFIDEQDLPAPPIRWALDDILEAAGHLTDFTITGIAAHHYALLHARTSALLGSSASNVYRTAHLQQRPFPTEYGTAGDDAWGQLYAFETKVACTARPGSTFRFHSKVYALSDYHVDGLFDRIQTLGLEISRRTSCALRTPERLELFEAKAACYAELKRMRKAVRFWFLHPRIWATRSTYKKTRKRLQRLIQDDHALVRREHIKPVYESTTR